MTISFVDPSARPEAASPNAGAAMDAGRKTETKDGEFTFDDLIDVINPLHHLPIVSTIYRAITGDEISVSARAIGGGLYGGPVGLLAAGATMAVEEAVGMSSDGVLASLFDETDEPTTLAAAPTTVDQSPDMPASGAATDDAQMAAITAALQSPTPPAQSTADATSPEAQASKYSDMRFFQLDANRPRPAAAAAPSAQPAAEAPRGLQLSAAQNELLQRFVAGAQGDAAPIAGAPSDGDTAEWFAARMQANLQKYVDAQAAGEPAPAAQ